LRPRLLDDHSEQSVQTCTQVDDATDQQPPLRLLDWARPTEPKRVRLDLRRRGESAILTGYGRSQHREAGV
jgi:hypothetical protein